MVRLKSARDWYCPEEPGRAKPGRRPRSAVNQKEEKKMLNRSEIARALAKAIAYKQCGKDLLAEEWAIKLVKLLECANILRDSNQDGNRY
jgi:hypothetical protein